MTQTDIQPVTGTTTAASGSRGLIDILTRPLWLLTGPILTKELRVASRRRRMYSLRLLYLVVLALFIIPIWHSVTDTVFRPATGATLVYRMSEVGKVLVPSLVWVQFFVVQMVAVLTMSTSISDEVFRRTLGALLSTPINAWQVVIGKLASRLVQCISLVLMSLPILALLTVFGGVRWQFVIVALCITLSTMLLVGSVTMFFSIFNRRPYMAILQAVLALGLLFALPFIVLVLASRHEGTATWIVSATTAFHPVIVLILETIGQVTARAGAFGLGLWIAPWWSCVLTNLGVAALVLLVCVRMVRRVSLAVAMGQPITWRKRRDSAKYPVAAPVAPTVACQTCQAEPVAQITDADVLPATQGLTNAPIVQPLAESETPAPQLALRESEAATQSPPRPLKGNPVYWKDTFRRRSSLMLRILNYLIIAAIIATCLPFFLSPHLGLENVPHHVYVVVLAILGGFGAVIAASTGITTERESRSWDIVLVSSLSNWQIIRGKFLAVLRRCGPGYGLLFAYATLFALLGYLHPVILLHLLAIIGSSVCFIAGLGVYVGTLVKKTTASIVILALALGMLWGGTPLLAALVDGMIHEIGQGSRHAFFHAVVQVNPAVQLVVTAEGSGRCSSQRIQREDKQRAIQDAQRAAAGVQYINLNPDRPKTPYDWPGKWKTMGDTTLAILLTAIGYGVVTLVLLKKATNRVRR